MNVTQANWMKSKLLEIKKSYRPVGKDSHTKSRGSFQVKDTFALSSCSGLQGLVWDGELVLSGHCEHTS